MIIRKFLFQKFHHPRHDKIEDVVENTGGDERNHRGLGRRDLFCDREHFHIEESGKRYDLSGNEPCKKELWGSRSVKRYFPQSRRGRGALDHRPVGIGKIDAAAVCGDAGDDGWR